MRHGFWKDVWLSTASEGQGAVAGSLQRRESAWGLENSGEGKESSTNRALGITAWIYPGRKLKLPSGWPPNSDVPCALQRPLRAQKGWGGGGRTGKVRRVRDSMKWQTAGCRAV